MPARAALVACLVNSALNLLLQLLVDTDSPFKDYVELAANVTLFKDYLVFLELLKVEVTTQLVELVCTGEIHQELNRLRS